MLAMSLLLGVFEPATTAASMAIGRPGTIYDAPAGRGAHRPCAMGWPKGRSAAEDDGGETFLPREEWALAQGKKVSQAALRLRRSRRSRSSARSSQGEALWLACAEQHPRGDDVADIDCQEQEAERFKRRERDHGVDNGGLNVGQNSRASTPADMKPSLSPGGGPKCQCRLSGPLYPIWSWPSAQTEPAPARQSAQRPAGSSWPLYERMPFRRRGSHRGWRTPRTSSPRARRCEQGPVLHGSRQWRPVWRRQGRWRRAVPPT